MTPERLAKIEEYANDARPGPWKATTRFLGDDPAYLECGPYPVTRIEIKGPKRLLTALFLERVRQDVPDLIEYVRKLEAERYELRLRLIAMGGDERRRG